MSFKEIANSSLLWTITGIGIAIVVVMILFYLRLCYKKALEMGVEKETVMAVIKSSVTFSIVPSIAVVAGLVTLAVVIGLPYGWFRLSVIGSVSYELMSANMALNALKLDLAALAAEKLPGLTPMVCANLPYNITTPILTKLAETPCIQSVTVMIQREVAQRVCAAPGDPDCGAFSLLMQYRMETELLFDVPKECFLPAPKVTSSVIRCVRRQRPAVEVEDEAFFLRVIRGAFLLRRKTLVNSLASALPEYGKDGIRAAIAAAGLPETIRGERLGLEEYARLTAALAETR